MKRRKAPASRQFGEAQARLGRDLRGRSLAVVTNGVTKSTPASKPSSLCPSLPSLLARMVNDSTFGRAQRVLLLSEIQKFGNTNDILNIPGPCPALFKEDLRSPGGIRFAASAYVLLNPR